MNYQEWKTEFEIAKKALEYWHQRADRVVRRYEDTRETYNAALKKFNLFASNVDVLQAAMYSIPPGVEVSRRFNDQDDDIARVAAIILQRNIMQDLDEPCSPFNQVLKHAVQDRLISGLGTCWLRLESDIEDTVDPSTGQTISQVAHQSIEIDYVYWKDLLWSPCRVWSERRWVAKRAYLTKEQLVARFGEEKAATVSMDTTPKETTNTGWADTTEQPKREASTAQVWECWDRTTKTVYWFSPNAPDFLDIREDFLGLENFEPMPEPLFGAMTSNKCVPIPDYIRWQDQYIELDEVNIRVALLVKALKVVGVYDRSCTGVQRLLTEGNDNDLIPVDNWAMFSEKGGVKGVVDWLPLDVIVNALQQLVAQRDLIKEQLYELTGISDIVRGASDPRETLGAQNLKAKFGTGRLQALQLEVETFVTAILRIKGEMVCRFYSTENKIKFSNILQTPDADLAQPAAASLADEVFTEYRLSVISGSMAQQDFARVKSERMEFMQAIGGFFNEAVQVVSQMPEALPLMLELIKFGLGGFQVGKEIEGIIDNFTKKAMDKANNPQPPEPPPPDPAVEAQKQKNQLDLQAKQQQLQFDQAESQQELAFTQQLNSQKLDYERQMNDIRLGYEQARLQYDQAIKGQQIEHSAQLHDQTLIARGQSHDLTLEERQQEAATRMETQASEAALAHHHSLQALGTDLAHQDMMHEQAEAANDLEDINDRKLD